MGVPRLELKSPESRCLWEAPLSREKPRGVVLPCEA